MKLMQLHPLFIPTRLQPINPSLAPVTISERVRYPSTGYKSPRQILSGVA